ncbi:uncharacterized protein [Elaeis guineensis]|uniref:uncharacterized protein isoform X2 n=1 Tax=Elaeis guineensis var. tenera TaxID=51953 RepID=UPI003C6DA263
MCERGKMVLIRCPFAKIKSTNGSAIGPEGRRKLQRGALTSPQWMGSLQDGEGPTDFLKMTYVPLVLLLDKECFLNNSQVFWSHQVFRGKVQRHGRY